MNVWLIGHPLESVPRHYRMQAQVEAEAEAEGFACLYSRLHYLHTERTAQRAVVTAFRCVTSARFRPIITV
jgi:hypothetical protein